MHPSIEFFLMKIKMTFASSETLNFESGLHDYYIGIL
jgi:hypothetical protein